jgi:hypothetical protein
MANELILIVEDNPQSLKLVRDTLQVKGYQTIEAAISNANHGRWIRRFPGKADQHPGTARDRPGDSRQAFGSALVC